MIKNPFYYNNPDEKEKVTRKCPYCGKQNTYGSLTCDQCFSYVYPEEEEAARLVVPEDNRPYNPLAIISLVLGIVGMIVWLCYPLGILDSIGAIVTGYMARKKAGEQKGANLALYGIICGSLSLLAAIILAIMDAVWKITSLYGTQ